MASSVSTSRNTVGGCPGEERSGYRSHKWHAVRVGTNRDDPRPSRRNAMTAAYSPFQRKVEEQEAARPAYQPHSWESVALPGCSWVLEVCPHSEIWEQEKERTNLSGPLR
ncbi:hypothetical protein NDU88_010914 [Pleurodeles waltl]|uniref:Uncharacterized protein n=1 Tax=Pleurodeles waltl TaxID=8319 RepID=A0AAV7QYW0_PLEWA|nr:hypothetical protein NDU88_010914 [Pleurodeles waltl]